MLRRLYTHTHTNSRLKRPLSSHSTGQTSPTGTQQIGGNHERVSASNILPPPAVSETFIRRREATANERAGRAEEQVILLTKRFGKLIREKGEPGFLQLYFSSAKKPISFRAVAHGPGGLEQKDQPEE